MRCSMKLCLIGVVMTALVALSAPLCLGVYDPPITRGDELPYRTDRILVRPKPGVPMWEMARLHAANRAQVTRVFEAIGSLQVVRLPAGADVMDYVARYNWSGLVEHAQPDYIWYLDSTHPNDPYYQDGSLWGLNNTGETGGKPDADIDAPEAWDMIYDAGDVLVAVIDSGINYNHEDLAGNMWTNPNESPGDANEDGYPGIAEVDDDGDELIDEDSQGREPGDPGYTNDLVNDDDENGYNDDIYGINAATGSGDPMDDYGHGTHVAGTIGAVGNNNKGVVGVAWNPKIMACRFAGSGGTGSTADAIECIEYARAKGAHIMNASWGSRLFDAELRNAIDAARADGIIFVASAGNGGSDNDISPHYPASFDLDNIVSVAATDRNDGLVFFSCYGLNSVDLGAPGVQVTSCFAGSNLSYATKSGTSMAAPHVSGAFALLKEMYFEEDYTELITRLLTTTDPLPSLAGKCRSGGRLNLNKAVTQSPVDLLVTPSDLSFAGQTGSFPSSTKTYWLTNFGTASLDWTAGNSESWLSLSANSGTLAAGESTTVDVWINSNANSLSADTYSDTVTFTNTTTGSGNTTREVSLVVGSVVYVDKQATGGDHNGGSWSNAFYTVQDGLDASSSGQEVWVAAEMYKEPVVLKDAVGLYGGFAGTETARAQRDWNANCTILDGDGINTVVTAESNPSESTIIDGFVIQNSLCLFPGGGIYCYNTAVTISHNVLKGNISHSAGGGIYCAGSPSPKIDSNMIVGNNSQLGGGGICINAGAPVITNNTIVGNAAARQVGANIGGGAIYSNGDNPTIANNIIAFNSSGIYVTDSHYAALYNNDVYGNTDYNYSGLSPGSGDISVDPQLASTFYGNLHIQQESPCVGAGNNNYVEGVLDIDGESRIQPGEGTVDIGADESDGTVWGTSGTIVRVSPDGNDTNDGSSWESAKKTVQAAIDTAAASGGEVWVEAAVYDGLSVVPPFVHLYGGFAGTETLRSQRDWLTNVTTLDGGEASRVVVAEAGYQLNTIDGFTIQDAQWIENGGGILCYYSSPYISHNTITDNSAARGAGICCYRSNRPVISENDITGNSATEFGGGIYTDECSAEVYNNVVASNSASLKGGGFYIWYPYSAVIANNTVVGNTSSVDGGGIHSGHGAPTISNNIVVFNSSGICNCEGSMTLRCNDVYGNTSYNYSGVQPGSGDISADPAFVDQQNGNLHILGASPCIDAGYDDDAPDTDKDGNPRPYDGDGDSEDVSDIGAYEYQFETIAQDAFSRTVSPGWGTADTGGAWAHLDFSTGGSWSDPDIYVGGGVGYLEFNGEEVSSGICTVGPNASDVQVVAKLWVAETAEELGAIARASSHNTFYALTWAPDIISPNMRLEKYSSGTQTVLDQTSGPTGTSTMVRLRVEGNALKARFWNPGSSEPTDWSLTATDSSLSTGKTGVWVNATDYMGFQFDDFEALEAVK